MLFHCVELPSSLLPDHLIPYRETCLTMHSNKDDLLQDIDAIVWEADPETLQFTYVSRGAERLLGYSLEHWLTKPTFWLDLIHPDDREDALAFCRAAVLDCEDHEFEYRMIAADGRVVWIRDIVRVVCRDEEMGCPDSGLAIAVRGVMLDVSDRKEAAGRHHDRWYQELIEQTADIVSVVDRHGTILYTSPSATRILGVEPAGRIGRLVFEDVHPDDLDAARAALDLSFRTHRPTPPLRVRYRHADHSWRWLEVVGRPFVDDGRELGIVNARDITERAALEDKVRHAQRIEALGRLTGAIAHDFNNVLMSIIGHSSLALDTTDPAELKRGLIEIQKAAELGTALTTQLLTFSQRRTDPPEVMDVNEALESLDTLLQRLLGPDVALEMTLEGWAGHVRLRRGQLEQIIMNLTVNARQAMPHGGKLHITTSTETWDVHQDDGVVRRGSLVVDVTDTGVGIPQEIIGQIFDPYFTTRPHGQGSGLGLSTVYGIVQDNGGTITVKSAVGEGTNFRIKLPLA